MIKEYKQYLKENNIVYSSDEVDPYGEENWDDEVLTPVLKIAKRQGKPYDQITDLFCRSNNLTSLEGIENLVNLLRLDCSLNNLTNLGGIKNLINLQELYCYRNNLISLEGIENLSNLKLLHCSSNNLTNLNGIENLINLEYLVVRNNDFPKDYLKDFQKTQMKKLKKIKTFLI